MAPDDFSRADASSIWLRPVRARRGPRPHLSREEITRAALELADEEGLEAVSMRRIAAKLGAGATSLYWYVNRKEDLYELMVDELIGEIALPARPSGDWRADLREIAIQTRAVMANHDWFPLLGIQPGLGPKTRRYGGLASAPLVAIGLGPPDWVPILATLNNYVLGFIHRESAWKRLRARSGLDDEEWRARLETLAARSGQQEPELADGLLTRAQLHGDESFQFGLEIVLDGIAIRLREIPGQRPAGRYA